MKPTKAFICGKPHVIQYRPDMVEAASLDTERRVISIKHSKETCDEDMWDGIIHEVIHAIDLELRLGLIETQVEYLGTFIADALLRNKWIKQ
jgi:hypothetical protein